MQRNYRNRTRSKRRGTAVVEFAVCLPVLMMIILGSMEACNMIFLKQALTEAAYQGALVSMKPDATSVAITTRINNVFTARGIVDTDVTVASGGFEGLSSGDRFDIVVTAGVSGNSISPVCIAGLSNVESTIAVMKQ